MSNRTTRSFGSLSHATEMAKTGNNNAPTQANIDRLTREKANVVKELEALKLKNNQTTAENKGLKEAVDSMKAELDSKETQLKKVENKYSNAKNKLKVLKNDTLELEGLRAKVTSLAKIKKHLEEKNKSLINQMQQEQKAYIQAHFAANWIAFPGTSGKQYHSSSNYNGSSSSAFQPKPYYRSMEYYRRSPEPRRRH